MANIALLLDEDVRVKLGEILRQRGYDVIHVLEAERGGTWSREQQESTKKICVPFVPSCKSPSPLGR